MRWESKEEDNTGKGSRRAYKKWDCWELGKRDGRHSFFFHSLPLHTPPALVMLRVLPGTVPHLQVLTPDPLLRYESWQHGVVPFRRTRIAKQTPFLPELAGSLHLGTQRTARRIYQDLGVPACPTTELRSSWVTIGCPCTRPSAPDVGTEQQRMHTVPEGTVIPAREGCPSRRP